MLQSTKYKSDPIVLARALSHVKRLRSLQASYDREAREWAVQGYRPHYCIHGTNLWVDWDPICGPCEDGFSQYKGETLYKAALMAAHSDIHEWYRRADLVRFASLETTMSSELRNLLSEWATEPVRDWYKSDKRRKSRKLP